MDKYCGNCPENVKRSAKYHVIQEDQQWKVELQYVTETGERWSPTTEVHEDLVNMVNRVKEIGNEKLGGAFYINEYRQVVVPTLKGYFLAGEYHTDLIFKIEDESGETVKLSGKAIDIYGKSLAIGNEWNYSLPGIPYILTANCKDIKYEVDVRPKVTKTVTLSRCIGETRARQMAERINVRDIFMGAGGRFYINEFGNLFKPVTQTSYVNYIYLGQLHLNSENSTDSASWFPKP